MEAIIRHQRWIVMLVFVLAAMLAALLAKGNNGRPGATGALVQVKFGRQLAPPGWVTGLEYINGWAGVSRSERVDVYAGSEARDHDNGLIVVVTTAGHRRRLHRLALQGAGPVTLLEAATERRPESSQPPLRFVTASGRTGSLDLTSDSVRLSG